MKDPIVEEVRRIRDDIARECDYDLNAIFAMLKKRQGERGGTRFVCPKDPSTPQESNIERSPANR